jgi:hypothetical protein
MTDDYDKLQHQLFQAVASAEPTEFRSAYLATPKREVHAWGTGVPIVQTPFTLRRSGLAVPTQSLGERVAAMAAQYMTSVELFGWPIPPAMSREFIGGHGTEEVLTECATLMMQLFVTGNPADPAVHRWLIRSTLANEALKKAELRLNQGNWLFFAPQVLLALAKVALLLAPSATTRDPDRRRGEVVTAALGMATHLGAGPPPTNEPTFGGVPRSMAIDLCCNQLFNRSIDLGTELGRHQQYRELAAAAFPGGAARYDQVFLESTGTTPDALFDVGFSALLKQNEIHIAVIDPTIFEQLDHPKEHVARGIELLAADTITLAAAVEKGVNEQGFEWSFTAMRESPMLKRAQGDLLILHPGFLIERICSSAFYWEVIAGLNTGVDEGGQRGKEAKALRGSFYDFTGRAAEEYVAERLKQIAGPQTTLGKRLWREEEIKDSYPKTKREEKCCDFLFQGVNSWIALDSVTTRIPQAVSEGGSWERLEVAIARIVDEKAEQIEVTINRLIEGDGSLPGQPIPANKPRYHPVIVSYNGFPWNQIMANEIHARLIAKGLLQDSRIHPLTVIDIDDLEHIEYAVETGLCSFEQLLDERVDANEVGTPIDHFIYRKAGLKRPTSLREPMLRAFKQTGTALGLDVSLLGMSAEEIEALEEGMPPDSGKAESSPSE